MESNNEADDNIDKVIIKPTITGSDDGVITTTGGGGGIFDSGDDACGGGGGEMPTSKNLAHAVLSVNEPRLPFAANI